MLIEFENVSLSLRGKPILRDISLNISCGVRCAIMGLNGAGKTTLLKLLSRFFQPDAGLHRIAGRAAMSHSARELARLIAYVPQDFPTEFPFTIWEFVMMGRFAWQKGIFPGEGDVRVVRDILFRLDLEPFAGCTIDTLSGGERQRVLLARALAQDTQVILLDEPLNHLDIKNRLFVLDLLRAENAAGRTIVAVMHDFREVSTHFEEVMFLQDGALLFHGPVAAGFTPAWLRAVFDVEVPV
jgi:iron complex transport system ATP-binding protein